MQIEKGPLVVQNYHYDVVEPESESKNNIQVQVQEFQNDENGTITDGKVIQILTPFDIHPEGAPFAISGLLGQVIKLVDFEGELEDLTGLEVQQLSQPLIGKIQTLTYQVTAETLESGYNLNFEANFD